MEPYLLKPIRCFTCGKVLESCKNKTNNRYCCIRMMLTNISN